MKLRDYQEDCVDSVLRGFRLFNSQLIVMATGMGKTIAFSHIANMMLSRGKVLVLAHREELVDQAVEKMQWVTGHYPEIEQAANEAMQHQQIVVASVQTLNSKRKFGRRMDKFDPKEFGLIIIDEAHRAIAPTYRRIINYFQKYNPNIKVLGVTATPDRLDNQALGQVFQHKAYDADIKFGIDRGWLVPIDQRFVWITDLDFSRVKTAGGDFTNKSLSEQMEYERNLHEVVGPTREITGDGRALVFAASVAHAERMSEIFNRHEPGSAYVVTGTTDKSERKAILRSHRNGSFKYLCNCMCFTEGYDDPDLSVVAVARPTKSRALYAQMVGRGTRPANGVVNDLEFVESRREAIASSQKPVIKIIDFVGNAGRHKLINSYDLFAGEMTPAREQVMKRVVEDSKRGKAAPSPDDIEEMVELEERRIRLKQKQEEWAKKRKELVAETRFQQKKVDPFNLFDKSASRKTMNKKGLSARQMNLLQDAGVPVDRLPAKELKRLCGVIQSRYRKGLCTYKQAKLLKRYGYDPRNITREDAAVLISEISDNGWKRPTRTTA